MTPPQSKIYAAILDHWHKNACSPTMRELCAAVGVKSTNGVANHLLALRRQGMIEGGYGTARALVPTKLAEHIRMFAGLLK
jgi:repressor LexA